MSSEEAMTWFTLRTAAEAAGVSRVTVRRYLDAGRFPNARREAGREDGRWQVPLGDLVGAGFRLQPSSAPMEEMVARASAADTVPAQSLLDTIAVQAEVIRRQAATIQHMAEALVARGPGSKA